MTIVQLVYKYLIINPSWCVCMCDSLCVFISWWETRYKVPTRIRVSDSLALWGDLAGPHKQNCLLHTQKP